MNELWHCFPSFIYVVIYLYILLSFGIFYTFILLTFIVTRDYWHLFGVHIKLVAVKPKAFLISSIKAPSSIYFTWKSFVFKNILFWRSGSIIL